MVRESNSGWVFSQIGTPSNSGWVFSQIGTPSALGVSRDERDRESAGKVV